MSGSSGERYVLTCYHVAFGAQARAGERVWALPPEDDSATPVLLGRAAVGQLGRVGPSSEPYFVDCALIALAAGIEGGPAWLRDALSALARRGTAAPLVGAAVVKDGASTGVTYGAIASARYVTESTVDNRGCLASDQLLVDSADEALVFSAAGDSGAALLDQAGRMLGLLWGTTPSGQGIACPIAPVLTHLGVEI